MDISLPSRSKCNRWDKQQRFRGIGVGLFCYICRAIASSQNNKEYNGEGLSEEDNYVNNRYMAIDMHTDFSFSNNPLRRFIGTDISVSHRSIRMKSWYAYDDIERCSSAVSLQTYTTPARFKKKSGGCRCFITLRKGFLRAAIYIQNVFDLYIYWNRFIYKLKMIYIQIENVLYINRDSIFWIVDFRFTKSNFSSSRFQNPFPFGRLFGMILNSSSLLKTFLARILEESYDMKRGQ